MARIRSIKPDFFKSATIARLTYRARLTFEGLWCLADDQGRLAADTRVIAGELWPQEDDVTWREVAADVDALLTLGLLREYTADGKVYLEVSSWTEHQKISKPTKSKLPTPPWTTDGDLQESSRSALSTGAPVDNSLRESYPEEGEGEGEGEKEGEGGTPPLSSSPPSPRCSEHQDVKDPPSCWQCRDARMARVEWERLDKLRPTPTITRELDCPDHPGYPHPDSHVGCPRCAEAVAA
jgi:hypothetical protein